jgi:hypothetical protein
MIVGIRLASTRRNFYIENKENMRKKNFFKADIRIDQRKDITTPTPPECEEGSRQTFRW